MLGFWHTILLVGPQGRNQLEASECRDCGWSVAGNKAAIAIAEQAHICAKHLHAMPATLGVSSGFKIA